MSPSSSDVPAESTTTIETGVLPAGPDELPGTGSSDGWLALVAALLIASGVGLIRLARRSQLEQG